MRKPTIGLLPLYLALYNEVVPQVRRQMESFIPRIATQLKKRGLTVITGTTCCTAGEFKTTVAGFERQEVDAIVTLHLAYSPSLEAAGVLAKTRLPLIVLNTTPDHDFGPKQDVGKLMFNHGIHGVQDLCNLLKRHRKEFYLETGHWEKSDVVDRVAGWVRAAALARAMRGMRVGLIGQPFKGMGDFAVPPDVLRRTIGVTTVVWDFKKTAAVMPADNAPAVRAEAARDKKIFTGSIADPAVSLRSLRAGLGVRRWLEENRLQAFTVNFLNITRASGFPAVPFLEAGKAMARGTGYAGEGDVLTAALTGALLTVFPQTTFTEMFCPDWAGNRIFLSHMGEVNYNLLNAKPRLFEKEYPFTNAGNPLVAAGTLKPGNAVLVNLAPQADDAYALIVAPVEVCNVPDNPRENSICGWIKPARPIADFLTAYSQAGGTHHLAMVYGEAADIVVKFGKIMGWNVIEIPSTKSQISNNIK